MPRRRGEQCETWAEKAGEGSRSTGTGRAPRSCGRYCFLSRAERASGMGCAFRTRVSGIGMCCLQRHGDGGLRCAFGTRCLGTERASGGARAC
eukprot:563146-Rhodomonas_salina.1